MPVDRMTEAPRRPDGGAASVVDPQVPAPADSEPRDALAELLHTPDEGDLTAAEKAKLVQLAEWKEAKARHEASAKALGKDISAREQWALELAAERQLYDTKGRIKLPDVEDGKGFELHPYPVAQIWPKYRDDDETGERFQVEHVIEALRECGQGHLVTDRPDSNPYTAYVRGRVTAWRQRLGESEGSRDEHGRLLDYDGNVLDADEASDPLNDRLALPPALRRVIEPVPVEHLQFSRRRLASPAVAEVDAILQGLQQRDSS